MKNGVKIIQTAGYNGARTVYNFVSPSLKLHNRYCHINLRGKIFSIIFLKAITAMILISGKLFMAAIKCRD